ncbi:MAG: hypothetical protein INQ03_14580 [Candidatus Heimdallarchaeota archaeon]|nr:hypothetical protein [Candidatus Heimdallarchaeota archaeon]
MSEYGIFQALVVLVIYVLTYIGYIRSKLGKLPKQILDGYITISIVVLLFNREEERFNVMIILFIFILTYIGIIHDKIDKTLSAVLGSMVAGVTLILLKVEDTHYGGPITEQGLLHFQDLQIIALIIGTLILVDVSQESGIFHFISIKILKASKGNPKTLVRYFGGLTLILSALVNNISAMMIVGSLTLIAAERLQLNPKPYIIVELSMTTVGGIITLVSSVPNIIISQTFGITFAEFFKVGFPLAIVCMIANFVIFERIYQEEFVMKIKPKEMERRVNEFDEWSAVSSKPFFYKSIIVLSLTITAFVFSEQIGLSLAVIAVVGAFTLITISGKKIEDVLSKLDWAMIAFFLGLFILIASLQVVHILSNIAIWLTGVLPQNSLIAAIILLWFVAIISGIVDNIVVAAAFGPILHAIAYVPGSPFNPMILAWSAIFSANFGGGLTPIGAPSAVVGLALLYRRTGNKMGWGEFIKTQGVATVVRLLITMVYLWILSILYYP